MGTSEPEPLRELRDSLFNANPAQFQLTPTEDLPNVWAVLMETGYSEGPVSLIAIAEGTTSLYFPQGGGIVGAGAHLPIRAASRAFLETAEAVLADLERGSGSALPRLGRVRFNVLTHGGLRVAEAPEEELGNGFGPVSVLFFAGQAVITQIRLLSQQRESDSQE